MLWVRAAGGPRCMSERPTTLNGPHLPGRTGAAPGARQVQRAGRWVRVASGALHMSEHPTPLQCNPPYDPAAGPTCQAAQGASPVPYRCSMLALVRKGCGLLYITEHPMALKRGPTCQAAKGASPAPYRCSMLGVGAQCHRATTHV